MEYVDDQLQLSRKQSYNATDCLISKHEKLTQNNLFNMPFKNVLRIYQFFFSFSETTNNNFRFQNHAVIPVLCQFESR